MLGEAHAQGLALAAFDQAYSRLAVERHDEQRAFAPIGETLFWAIVCDDGYDELLGEKRYRPMRDEHIDGRLLAGIRWGRNKVTHSQLIAHSKHYGTELGHWVLGKGVLGTIDHMRWADLSHVAPERKDYGRDVYECDLIGRSIVDTIDAARRWLFGPPLSLTAVVVARP